ncbi:MAG: hypothetical protein RL096_90 [Actinomycetota bacterium]
MRTATKSAIGILSLGVIAASYTAGTAAQIGFGAAPVSNSSAAGESTAVDPSVVVEPTPIAVETEEVGEAGDDDVTSVPVQTKAAATSATTPTATKSATATATPTPTAAKTAAAATPTATPTPTPTKTASTVATSVAKTGSAINYKYGTIQLEVVKSGSKITSINLIQASTKGREWASVPSMLVTAAISAQGSGFGNISGATFSTQAFKSALESALAKF